MPPPNKRTDWTPRSIFATYGMVSEVSERSARAVQVSFFLPWPANKWPILKAHLDTLNGYYAAKEIQGEARGLSRPVVRVTLKWEAALDFMRSIGWECGKPKKDQAMRVWKHWAERPRLGGARCL